MAMWTWIDRVREDVDQARLHALANRYTMLEKQMERYEWDLEARLERGYECCCEKCEEGQWQDCLADKARNERRAEWDLEMELIADKLELAGARLMRPYEHWNEHERYMEYMENRY